jgi:hypothetical protein
MQNPLSQYRNNLRKAATGRNLCPRDFPVESLGISRVGFLMYRRSELLVLLIHDLQRLDLLIIVINDYVGGEL